MVRPIPPDALWIKPGTVGELFRSRLVMQAAPRNGDFCTPTVIGAEEYDFAERDLRYSIPMFHLLTNDREFADHNKGLLSGWLSTWTGRAIAAARTLQPLWSLPDAKPPVRLSPPLECPLVVC